MVKGWKQFMITSSFFCVPLLLCGGFFLSGNIDDLNLEKNGWPARSRKIEITSSVDKAQQPAIVWTANGNARQPLLVGLHTWSGGYSQAGGETVYARWCQKNNWHFIHPHFRGPNRTPKALGSELAVQDILDSVEYMKKNFTVDEDRIYLVGVSGGGHAALLMAGRAPEVWAGVSAWCPISDVEAWWEHHAIKNKKYQPGRYAKDIENTVGGRPDTDPSRQLDCKKRSPVTYLSQGSKINLDINHGVFDGRKGSVPFIHSIWAFNSLVESSHQIKKPQWKKYYETLKLPEELKPALPDELYGNKPPLFRRISGNTRLTIFEGGHEIVHLAALNWLSHQRKGKNAKWDLDKIVKIPTGAEESKANK